MPQSMPPGLTQEHVLKVLADLDAGIDHPFGLPTKFEVVHEGKRYPPKAVIGLACRYLKGRLLRLDEFSGGEAPGQANFVLRRQGDKAPPAAPPRPGRNHRRPARADDRPEGAGQALAVAERTPAQLCGAGRPEPPPGEVGGGVRRLSRFGVFGNTA